VPIGHRPAPPTDTCRLAFSGTNWGLPWTCVLWAQLTNVGARQQADLDSIVQTIANAWGTNLAVQAGTQYAGNTLTAEWITGAGSQLNSVMTHADVPSAAVSSPDVATCVVIDWITGQRYRGGHPRTYFPSIATTSIQNGSQVTAAQRTATVAAALAFRTAVNAATHGNISTVTLGTVRFQSAGAWLSPPTFVAYNGAKVRTILGTQRRRLGA